MKPLVTLSLGLLLLSGCTDAARSLISSYGEKALVVCFSGGQQIYHAETTGKVMSLEGGGWAFRTSDGIYVQTFADCFVAVKE
jgi:hypothetical protein